LQQYNDGLVGHDEYGELIEQREIERSYALDVKENFSGARGKNGKKISRIQKILNPMDVKRVRSIGGLSMYLTKYITKQEKGQRFACANWHCSRRVSRMFTRTTVSPSTFRYMQSFNNYKIDMDTGECWNPDPIKKQFYTMVYVYNKAAPLPFLKEMEQVNKWIMGGLEVDKLPMECDETYKKFYCRDVRTADILQVQ
jgi:hypothetical protein